MLTVNSYIKLHFWEEKWFVGEGDDFFFNLRDIEAYFVVFSHFFKSIFEVFVLFSVTFCLWNPQ